MTTTATRAGRRSVGAGLTLERRRFTIDEYERMIEAGILYEDERVELLEGEIVCIAPIGTPHSGCVDFLNRWFTLHLPPTALVRVQNPIRLEPGSEPQPDICIVRYRADYYRARHPIPEDIFLVIEVADTTLSYDRDVKLPLYAAAGIPEAWIVDLAVGQVLVYWSPRRGRYTRSQVVERDGTLTPRAFPDLHLPAADLLG
jgi:Uma2 family endonuclease